MHAAWNNESTAVIHTLVDRGANLNAQDNQGRTPLMYAAEKNRNPDVLAALIKRGADMGIKNISGLTALMCCKSQGKDAAVNLLIEAELKIKEFEE